MPGSIFPEAVYLPQPILDKLNQVMINSQEPYLALHADGSFLACNQAFCRLWGSSQEDLTDKLTPSLARLLQEIFQNIQQQAICQRLDTEICREDGQRLILDLFIMQQYDQGGNPICYLIDLHDITRQKQAADDLRHSEERYRLIAENAYDMITIVDARNGLYKYVSPSHERVLGYSAPDLLGTPWPDLIHPDDLPLVAEQFCRGFAQGSGSAVYRHYNKNGDYVWLYTIGTVLQETEYHGDILLIARDIDQLKQTEHRLVESEEKYRLITDNTQDLILMLDPVDMSCTFASPSSERILGYRENDMLGTAIFDYIHPEDLEGILQNTRGFISRSIGDGIQYRLQRKDGTYLWAESIGKVFENNEGKWQLLLSTRDISERKRGEEALKASEARLRESEKELKHQLDYVNYLINNMNEIFAIYDRNQKIIFVNHGTNKPLGFEPNELIGRSALSLVAGSQKDKIALQIQERLEKGGFASFETVLLRKDGSEMLVRIKSSSIMENDEIRGVMVLIDDISEHRQLEREMARLDQLNTVGEMAAGLGHEIRNPMTTVKGFLQLLSQDKDLQSYKDYFHIMLEELERANAIISEFLSLAKNKLVNLRLSNLNSLITAIYPLLHADALLSDKTVVLDLKAIPELLLDEAEIRQILINLVRNGLESMSAGGRVFVKTFREGHEVVLAVQDEGPGIEPELLDKLGTPFLTTKADGTGLGLAICYSIVARHNASIHPVTGAGGTTIVIRFPIPKVSEPSSP